MFDFCGPTNSAGTSPFCEAFRTRAMDELFHRVGEAEKKDKSPETGRSYVRRFFRIAKEIFNNTSSYVPLISAVFK